MTELSEELSSPSDTISGRKSSRINVECQIRINDVCQIRVVYGTCPADV